MSRRALLASGATAGVALVAGRPARVLAKSSAPAFKRLDLRTISVQTDRYTGWPTLARRKSGELLLVASGGREAHVCPFGRVELMRSRDDGATWTWPRTLIDTAIDDRDAGLLETARGSILVTTFTSLAWEPILARAEKQTDSWPAEKLARWRAASRRTNAEERRAALGTWMIRSTDGGASWSPLAPCPVNSPHGPVRLSDGRILYAGKELWRDTDRVGVCESTDDGVTWRWLAEIPARTGDKRANYHELHAVETESGRLIAHLRNHNARNSRETLQSESSDGGKTWSTPRAIGVWGLPSHLLRLRDGRLLMSYGHRRAPLGNQARVSEDDGRTWSEPIMFHVEASSGDLGYPSTVELDDGELITVWYEVLAGSPRALLRQARWKIL